LPDSNDLFARQEWFIYQVAMIYLPGRNQVVMIYLPGSNDLGAK
jgi:hypothetical protein